MKKVYSNLNPVVIDSGAAAAISSEIQVAELRGSIRDVNVTVDIDHTWTNDLRIVLVAPNGTEVVLVSGEGGDGDHFRRTTFDDGALTSVTDAAPPFRGTFRPQESLSSLNETDPNGTWRLIVDDRAFQDGGSLNRWSLNIETCNYTFDNNTPVPIDPGPANTVTSQIVTDNLGGLVVGAVRVTVDIDHTWDDDLTITLIGPDGTSVVLVERQGDRDDGFDHTTFDDDASDSVNDAAAPFRGTFRPDQPLSAFQGQLAGGTWTLRIQDQAPQDGGSLNRWELELDTCRATPRVESDFGIDVEFLGGLTVNQRSVFELAAARWAEIIVGDLPEARVDGRLVDDLLIRAQGKQIDGPRGILGQAGPRRIRPGTSLPVTGVMTFDTADLADMEEDGSLVDVIIHEMGHVLGIGTLWKRMDLIERSGTRDPVFSGRHAMAEYATLLGEAQPRRVPVANTGGAGTREGHWRESTFDDELMTGFVAQGSNPLSRVTIACLRDMGYEVNLDVADVYALPGPSVFAAVVSGRHRSCNMTCPQIEVLPSG